MTKLFEDLTFKEDIMFGKVMEDETLCKALLECLLDTKINSITYQEREKRMDLYVDGKYVRMDLFVKDDQEVIYNAEMQQKSANKKRQDELPLRLRYYQSLIDGNCFEYGEDYLKLNDSYILLICDFDLFGRGQYKYTFQKKCIEQPDLTLEDRATVIIYNTKGDTTNAPEGIRQLFEYIEKRSINGEFVNALDTAIKQAKGDRGERSSRMKALFYWRDVREDAYAEGHEEELVKNVRAVMESLQIPIGQAFSILQIPEDEQSRVLQLIDAS